jgi:hypothetical protein
MFERYILENYSTTAYGQGLQDYLNILENPSHVGTVDFKIIPKNLVECYLLELRKKGLSGGTIKSYHGILKTVCNNMGFPFSIVAQHNKMIQTWINEDITQASASFDFVNDLPKLFNACFSMKGWNEQEKVKNWVMFLFSIVMMARASEVASPYCPVYEDIEFPPVGSGWTTDGLPNYIIISLRYKKMALKALEEEDFW